MEIDYSNKIIDLCDRLIDWFEWDLEKDEKDWIEKGSRSVKTDDTIKLIVYKSKSEARFNPNLSIISLYDSIQSQSSYRYGFIDFLQFNSIDDFKNEEIFNKSVLIKIIQEIIELKTDWESNEFQKIKTKFNNVFGRNLENNIQIEPEILIDLNQLITSGFFKMTKLQDSGEKIYSNDTFSVSSKIGFSYDLTILFDWLKKNPVELESSNGANIHITLFGKLDPINLVYSSWIFTIKKGNTIWLLSDAAEFDNPLQKESRLQRRSIWKDKEFKENNIDLPYHLFNTIEKEISQSLISNTDFEHHKKVILNRNEFETFLVEKGIKWSSISVNLNTYNEIETIVAKKDGSILCIYYNATNTITVFKRPQYFFKSFEDLKEQESVFIIFVIEEALRWAVASQDSQKNGSFRSRFYER